MALAALLVFGSAHADTCAGASTSKAMQQCEYDEFLSVQSVYAQRYKALSAPLPARHRARLARMQQAWLRYRRAACEFESGAVEGGTAQPLVNYRCLARMTRVRADELAAMAQCREGDIACVARPVTGR